MATMVAVPDAGDPRLADYVRLTDVHLRRSLEAPAGLFIAEGQKVIRRAAAAGFVLRSMLVTADRAEAAMELAAGLAGAASMAGGGPGYPVYVVPPEVAQGLTGYRVHRGALASVQRRPLPGVADVLAGARRIAVLEDIADHTNVGAIFRCVAALGFDGVILAPRCADPLYRRSVRVSMGAVFSVPYARMADWRGGLGELRAAGFRLLALTPAAGAVPIADARAAVAAPDAFGLRQHTGEAGPGGAGTARATGTTAGPVSRVALLLGSEGDGLSARWRDQADMNVAIPMSRGIDSLNVAAAAAIACYVLA